MLHILDALQFRHLYFHIFYKDMTMFPSYGKYNLGLSKGASLHNCCLLSLQPESQVHLSSSKVQVV